MSDVVEDDSIDTQVCWEQIERARHPFQHTRIFAGKDQLPRLLAIHALLAAWERMVAEATELDVALRKLEWWRFQCLQQSWESSKHPVLRYLVNSGAAANVDLNLVSELLNQCEQRLDAATLQDTEQLQNFCVRLGQVQADLVASAENGVQASVTASAGLAQLMRESIGPAAENRFWWIPMNSLARHGVNRTQLVDDFDSEQVAALFKDVIEEVTARSGSGPGDSICNNHYKLIELLSIRQLERAKEKSPKEFSAELNRMTITELWSVWRMAQKMKRAELKPRPC